MSYLYLFAAIIAEIFATTMLKDTNSFTVLLPTVFCILGYIVAFYMLSLCVQNIPTGIIYALWSGLGIVGIALLGWIINKQTLDIPAITGIVLILTGVLVIKIFSHSLSDSNNVGSSTVLHWMPRFDRASLRSSSLTDMLENFFKLFFMNILSFCDNITSPILAAYVMCLFADKILLP